MDQGPTQPMPPHIWHLMHASCCAVACLQAYKLACCGSLVPTTRHHPAHIYIGHGGGSTPDATFVYTPSCCLPASASSSISTDAGRRKAMMLYITFACSSLRVHQDSTAVWRSRL